MPFFLNMKVGLYFGSFNPIHIGHLAIANYMVEFSDIDELWFVISPQNPEKSKATLLYDYDRYEMVERAIKGFDTMKASTVEFALPKPSYTIVTLTHLSTIYKQYEFCLIMGGDNLCTFKKWRNYQYILDNFKLYVYSRPNYDIPSEFKNHPSVRYFNAPLMEISSSFIRQSIKKNKNIKAFMPQDAWEYLEKMNFYKT